MTIITSTARTRLRELTTNDATFINALLNQATFLRYIGDRNVRSVDDAARFIDEVYRRSYVDHGFGLYVVESSRTQQPMGLCGFVRRPALPSADLGFAFLPEYEGQGYAHESAAAILEVGLTRFGMNEVLAIVQEDNARSRRLLERLGFEHDGDRMLPGATTPVLVLIRRSPRPAAVHEAEPAPGS